MGFLFGCLFFLSWWFDVGFFFGCFSFFYFERFLDVSLMFWYLNWWFDAGFLCDFFLKGSFWMIFGDLMLNLLWWFPMILDDFLSWWFDVGFSGCFYMIFFDLMIRCWIFLEIHFSGHFCKDEKPHSPFFGWNERDRGNNLMMTLRQVDMISLVSWFWSSESIYLDSFWFDFGFSEREKLLELGFLIAPREKTSVRSSLATFSQHQTREKIAADVLRFQEMLQDFEITNNWDLGFYGHEGDVGARCLSHWWGSLGGKQISNTFFSGKMQKKQTGIHTCATNVSSSDFNSTKTCTYIVYVHIKTTVTTSVSKYVLYIWFMPSIPTKLTTHKKPESNHRHWSHLNGCGIMYPDPWNQQQKNTWKEAFWPQKETSCCNHD